MSRSGRLGVPLEALAAPDPEPLLKGLDAMRHGLSGRLHGLVDRQQALMAQALRADAFAAEMEGKSDGALEMELGRCRAVFRRGRESQISESLVRTLAALREAGLRAWGLRAYPVQLAGVLGLYRGCLVEMATGEGKTIVAAMAAVLAGWSGRPCHVVTVNDYLARRDAEQFAKIGQWCGLSVASVISTMQPQQRRGAYQADVVYTTSKELLADFLRDRIALGSSAEADRLALRQLRGSDLALRSVVQRGLHTAIVDEADSVLIDEAVTPLIISRERLNESLRQACVEAYRLAEQLETPRDYTLDTPQKQVNLTSKGEKRLAVLAESLPALWRGEDRRRELVEQALQAKAYFFREKQYIVQDGKVVIVDEFSGRLMPQRTWREGLHQAIEVREGLEATSPSETIARMSFQRFFRLFKKLGGMSGTARESAGELWQIYRLPVVAIPTNRPVARSREPERRFRSKEEKWAAIVAEIGAVHATQRPILVGTRSIEDSEMLAAKLLERGFDFRVLNARRHAEEAGIIAGAGQKGAITIATNMAGRGTDIRLGKGIAERGGLHVIATERHEAGRIDRQLFGRAGRQGDAGSERAFVSLDDELYRRFLPAPLRFPLLWLMQSTPVLGRMGMGLGLRWAQWIAQHRAYRQRRQVLQSDQWLEESLGFAGSQKT